MKAHGGVDMATGAGEASPHISRDTAWSRVKGSADGVGLLSARWDDYIAFVDCASGMDDEQIFTRRSFRLLSIVRSVRDKRRRACPLAYFSKDSISGRIASAQIR